MQTWFALITNNHVLSSQFRLMAALSRFFWVQNHLKWFAIPFFWRLPGTGAWPMPRRLTVWGCTLGNRTAHLWLWSQIQYLTSWAIQPATNYSSAILFLGLEVHSLQYIMLFSRTTFQMIWFFPPIVFLHCPVLCMICSALTHREGQMLEHTIFFYCDP